MLPGPFWSLGDVIPEQIYVTRFAREKHIFSRMYIYIYIYMCIVIVIVVLIVIAKSR